jgi:hypothetical protein
MMRHFDAAVMKAVTLCYKPFLKPEEAVIYCNLARTQLAKKLDEQGIFKNACMYYKREELDRMLLGAPSP